jgi:DnaJ-class molecular chaperone
MADTASASLPICPDCDGFPVVHIATGVLHADGTRATLAVTCRTCHGTGHVSRTRALVGGRK